MSRDRVVVARADTEAVGIRSFTLRQEDGRALPAFSPGAHIDVEVGPGLTRQYSLANLAEGPAQTYEIAVKLEPESRGGSAAMHRIGVGDRLDISGPRNNFELDLAGERYLLVAGGIGITPILPMYFKLVQLKKNVGLHYFARSHDHVAFLDRLSEGVARKDVRLHLGLSPDEVSATLADLLVRQGDCQLYYCGPAPLMAEIDRLAMGRWPADAVRCEHFGARVDVGEGDVDFTVELARSGKSFTVPVGETIVDVLSRHGVIVDTSCCQGICGTCVTAVLAGIPDHRDDYLLDDEKEAGDRMALCVSRAKTPVIVLDL